MRAATAWPAGDSGPFLTLTFLRRLRAAAWFLALGCGLLFWGSLVGTGLAWTSSSFMGMVALGEVAMLAFLPAWFLLGAAVALTPRVLEDSPMRPLRLAFLASAVGYAAGFAVTAWTVLSPWGGFFLGLWSVPMVALVSYAPARYSPIVVAHGILFALATRGLPDHLAFVCDLGVLTLWLGASAGVALQVLAPADPSDALRWIGLVGVGYLILAVGCGLAARRLSAAPSRGPAGPSRDPSP